MSGRRCSVDERLGMCHRESCSSRHEAFCSLEKVIGECRRKPCNSRHIGSSRFEDNAGWCPRESVVSFNILNNITHRKKSLPPICKSWQDGNCFPLRAGECSRRHYYTDDDEILPQSRRFLDENDGGSSVHTMTNFSSPYSVSIKKEIVKKRNVEVDLETGRKKSWVETMEQEEMETGVSGII